MKVRKLLILFLIILFTVLQCTALNYIQIFRTKPDILLILLIFFSLSLGRIHGLGLGAVCGFFTEATSGIPCGLAVFTYSVGGLVLGHLGRWVYQQRIFGEICICFISSFTIYFFLFILFQIHNASLSLFNTLISVILPASFYTAFVSPVLFRFFKIILNIK